MASVPYIGTALSNLGKADSVLLTGVTADASELNKLDGVVASTAQINTLAGLTEGVTLALGEAVENIADLTADYDTVELDGEAEIVAALNATNTAVNAILAALEAFGIMAEAE